MKGLPNRPLRRRSPAETSKNNKKSRQALDHQGLSFNSGNVCIVV